MDNDIKELIDRQSKLQNNVDKYGIKINEYPKLDNGIVVEAVRLSDNYIRDKKEFDKHFSILRMFNESLTKEQKREMSKHRRKNREVK